MTLIIMLVQGPVMFDKSGDRKGLTQIEQFQNDTEVQVGIYNPSLTLANKINWDASQKIYWKGLHLQINN